VITRIANQAAAIVLDATQPHSCHHAQERETA
jgi:hypothetical protein